jgi:hypothetical protein
MACHSLWAYGFHASGLDPLRQGDEVARGQQMLALKAVINAHRKAGGCGGNGLRAQAAAIKRLWQGE